MLEYLIDWFVPESSWANLFSYISTRTIAAGSTSLALSLFLGSFFITLLTRFQIGQQIRQEGPQSHLQKKGTPTMGGILILLSTLVSALFWANWHSFFVWVLLLALVSFGLVGFLDDWIKLTQKSSDGLSVKQKLLLQSVMALLLSFLIYAQFGNQSYIIPFFKDFEIDLGYGFIAITYFAIISFSNASNLTDGLDGLVILPIMLIVAGLAIFAYLSGNAIYSQYLFLPKITGAGEIVVVCAALLGASVGFLWFNTFPAQVFMGDVGSLALGAFVGVLAVLVRQEVVAIIMGGLLVLEAASVILQVSYFKLTKRRILKMSPLHHHFELTGLSEPKISVRFWIITAILVLIGLATIKLR